MLTAFARTLHFHKAIPYPDLVDKTALPLNENTHYNVFFIELNVLDTILKPFVTLKTR